MKTLRLTADESRAYSAGERCFWRAMKPQPDHFHRDIIGKSKPYAEEDWNRLIPQIGETEITCPYGTPGDRIRLSAPNPPFLDTITQTVITRVTVTERDGKWGWLVEVGA